MDKQGFAEFLQERKIAPEQVTDFTNFTARFEDYLRQTGSADSLEAATVEATTAFSERMVAQGLNTFDNYRALALYGRFAGNNDLYLAVLALLDGAEALDNLYSKLGDHVGADRRDHIFAGIELPPLGTPNERKPPITAAVIERMQASLGEEICRSILSGCLRDLSDEWFQAPRQKYLELGDLDAFLAWKGDDFIAQLERIKDENGLFFNQEIDEQVIGFVESVPEIRQGTREGATLYEIKIPYMAKEYLAERDTQMKRYYYCHCPWVRESLLTSDVQVPPVFCNCSAGFHKKYWEVVLDQPLHAEIVESVLQGDLWCKIAIRLPADRPERFPKGTSQ